MNRLDRAREFRRRTQATIRAAQQLMRLDELSAEELKDMVNLYDPYEVGKAYVVGDIVRFDSKLYRVVQEHMSQADWIPNELPALYAEIVPAGVIPEYSVGTVYAIGNQVIFEGNLYRSTIDNNVWSPVGYPAGWEAV